MFSPPDHRKSSLEGRADWCLWNFVADVQVNGFQLPLLIDTGSEVSILSENMLNKINPKQQIRLKKPPHTLVHYLGGSIPVMGCFQTSRLQRAICRDSFYVVQNGRSLLGTDAHDQLGRADAMHGLRLILSGAPLKCSHVNTADSHSHPGPYKVGRSPAAPVCVGAQFSAESFKYSLQAHPYIITCSWR